MLKGKTLTILAGVVVAGSIMGLSAAAVQGTYSAAQSAKSSEMQSAISTDTPSNVSTSSDLVGSTIQSTTVESKTTEEKKVMSEATSTAKGITTSNAGETTTSSSLKKQAPPKYAVVNPDTGEYVNASNKDYEKYKAELGGDAGTVNPDQSETIKALREKMQSIWDTKSSAARVVK